MIVQTPDPVTLVGGAEVRPVDIKAALTYAPVIVAADGGADRLLSLGHVPRAVIGDMDSLTPAASLGFSDKLFPIAEQDSTDFDKALRNIDAPLVIGLGLSGGRFDHELAAMHVLLAHPDRPCILVGSESIVALCPPHIALDIQAGTVVSLFPFASVGIESTGLKWQTAGIAFAPGKRIGTSNQAEGPVTLTAQAPAMMLILPRSCLGQLVRAVLDVPVAGRWPARGQ